MTNWTIRRIEPVPEGGATIDCLSGTYPTQITLVDKDTQEVSTTQVCVNPHGDHCEILRGLAVSYSPNDWSDECPPGP